MQSKKSEQIVLHGNTSLPIEYRDFVFQEEDGTVLILYGWAKTIMIIRSHAQYAFDTQKIDETQFNEYHEMIERVFGVSKDQSVTCSNFILGPENLKDFDGYLDIIQNHFFAYKNRLQAPCNRYYNDRGEHINGWKLKHTVQGTNQEGVVIRVEAVQCPLEDRSYFGMIKKWFGF